MAVRLPKVPHGWREFLKEYAIVVLGVLTALVLAACNPTKVATDRCWSTSTLRANIGGTVFDFPAAAVPSPEPGNAAGLLKPRYPRGSSSQPRLLWCQDRRHVPVKLSSVSLTAANVAAPAGFEAPPGQPFPTIAVYDPKDAYLRHFPRLADAAPPLKWSLIGGPSADGSLTRYRYVDGSGGTSTVSCFEFRDVPPKLAAQGPLCDVKVRLGTLYGFIRFRPGRTGSQAYPGLIEAAAAYLSGLHRKN